jgi:hypothetical protein
MAVQLAEVVFPVAEGENMKQARIIASTLGSVALTISGHHFVRANGLMPEVDKLERRPEAIERVRQTIRGMGWQIDGISDQKTGKGNLTAFKAGKSSAEVQLKSFATLMDWLELYQQVTFSEAKE